MEMQWCWCGFHCTPRWILGCWRSPWIKEHLSPSPGSTWICASEIAAESQHWSVDLEQAWEGGLYMHMPVLLAQSTSRLNLLASLLYCHSVLPSSSLFNPFLGSLPFPAPVMDLPVLGSPLLLCWHVQHVSRLPAGAPGPYHCCKTAGGCTFAIAQWIGPLW